MALNWVVNKLFLKFVSLEFPSTSGTYASENLSSSQSSVTIKVNSVHSVLSAPCIYSIVFWAVRAPKCMFCQFNPTAFVLFMVKVEFSVHTFLPLCSLPYYNEANVSCLYLHHMLSTSQFMHVWVNYWTVRMRIGWRLIVLMREEAFFCAELVASNVTAEQAGVDVRRTLNIINLFTFCKQQPEIII